MSRKAPQRNMPLPGQESVWDYPRPPRLEAVGEPIRIVAAGVEVVRTNNAFRVLETSHPPTYYLPPTDIDPDLLVPGSGRSFCEWKGVATYWSLQIGERRIENCGWSYPEPSATFLPLRDHVAFYCAVMDACFVGERQARPQPGGFYGGWVTSDLAGPFKGEPGTEFW